MDRSTRPSPVGSVEPASFLSVDLPESRLPLIPGDQRRLGQWKVLAPLQGLPRDRDIGGLRVPLSYVLLLLNRAALIERYPVALANLEKVQELQDQMIAHGANGTMPVVQASYHPGPNTNVWVCWLDRKQFDYARGAEGNLTIVFPKHAHEANLAKGDERIEQIVLPSGERMGGVYVFRQGGQAQGYWPYKKLFPVWNKTPDAADAEGWPAHADQVLWQIADTSDDFRRGGEAIVRVTETEAQAARPALKRGQLVVVRPARPPEHGTDIAALARLKLMESATGPRPAQYGHLQADQIVRDALGIEIGEIAVIEPCEIQRRLRVFDYLIGTPTYVICRVQSADASTVEREVSLVDELTLGLLGVESGDAVVIEGVPESSSGDTKVPWVRVKAFQTTDDVLERRSRLSGGDLTCRFPTARDSLGTFPDLPWVFLDSAARTALGLSGQKLGVVRIRASRRYQLVKELRELLLVVAVAFIGILSLFRDTMRYALVGSLVFLVLTVVILRLRSRMSRTLNPPAGRGPRPPS